MYSNFMENNQNQDSSLNDGSVKALFFTGIGVLVIVALFVGLFVMSRSSNDSDNSNVADEQNSSGNEAAPSDRTDDSSSASDEDSLINAQDNDVDDSTGQNDPNPVDSNNQSNKQENKNMISIKSASDIPKAEKDYKVTLKTEEGDIVMELTQDTPITTGNFVTLAREGFYNNVIFHRVINGFMIQGGDPDGTGRGGPGYKFDDEPFEGEYTRGTVAMANSGPNTNGSQFFIMHDDNQLPPNYVIFGQVVEGMDVVDKIATAETAPNGGGENSSPVNPVKILSAEVE